MISLLLSNKTHANYGLLSLYAVFGQILLIACGFMAVCNYTWQVCLFARYFIILVQGSPLVLQCHINNNYVLARIHDIATRV